MAVNTIINPIDVRILQPSRIGLVNEATEGLSATLVNSAEGGVIRSRFTITEAVTIIAAGNNAAKAGGVKLFDFPAGKLIPIGARIAARLNLSEATMSTTAGEIGLGTVVASGAAAVLGGTATFENILEGGSPALGNITAGSTINAAVYDDTRSLLPATGISASLFLNAATTFANATASNLLILPGSEIDVWWIHMEP